MQNENITIGFTKVVASGGSVVRSCEAFISLSIHF